MLLVVRGQEMVVCHMSIDILQRNEGSIITALKIRCEAYNDGTLVTYIKDADGNEIAKVETKR